MGSFFLELAHKAEIVTTEWTVPPSGPHVTAAKKKQKKKNKTTR